MNLVWCVCLAYLLQAALVDVGDADEVLAVLERIERQRVPRPTPPVNQPDPCRPLAWLTLVAAVA